MLAVYQLYLNQWLQIRWRRWMTSQYLGDWLHQANHYRMQLQGDAADNPDQRMTDDVKLFVDRTLNIGVGLLSSIVTLASFVAILWGLSNEAPLHLFGTGYRHSRLPRLGALIYSVLGTVLTHLIGRPLVGINFQQQQYRSGFSFQPGARPRKCRTDRAAAAASRSSARGCGRAFDAWSRTGSPS